MLFRKVTCTDHNIHVFGHRHELFCSRFITVQIAKAKVFHWILSMDINSSRQELLQGVGDILTTLPHRSQSAEQSRLPPTTAATKVTADCLVSIF